MTARDEHAETHYQLYKLLAFAIQELDWFANQRNVNDALSLPSAQHVITNRAQLAVNRIEQQNPHFFAGYTTYRRGELYPKEEEHGQPK